jgi:hypothetical protein
MVSMIPLKKLHLVDGAVRSALAARAVVADHDDDGVVELTGLLEVVEQATDVMIAVGDEPGVDLGHPAKELLLVIAQRVPRSDHVHRRPGLALRALRVDVGVERRQLGPRGDEPHLELTSEHLLAVLLVAHVELALVLVGPLLGHVVRGVGATGREVHHPRLVGIRRLSVADVLQRLVGDVLGEVVAVLGLGGLLDRLVVLDEQRVPLVRLSAQEAVEALEAATERPLLPRAGGVVVVVRREVPLAERVRAVAVVDEDLRDHRVLEGDAPVGGRKAGGELRDARHTVRRGVTPGEETRARRRAERRGVKLRVAQPHLGDTRHVGGLDETAVAVEGAEADVVPADVEDVRGAVLGLHRLEGRPIGLGITSIECDSSVEALLGHGMSPL